MRRLFYDVYTSRLRAEALLILADVGAFVSALLYAAGAFPPRVDPWDAALLAVWSAFPRAAAKILGRLEYQLRFFRAFGGSLLFVVVTTVLLLGGWDLLVAAVPRGESIDPALVLVTFFAWCSGFFLFHPRTYRLYDFLVLGLLVVGVRAGRPMGALWVPLCLTSVLLSSAVRHTLYDVFGDAPHRKVNLQNARAVGLVAAGATLAVVGLAYVLIHDVAGFTGAGASRDGGRDVGLSLRREVEGGEDDSAEPGGPGAMPPSEGASEARGGRVIGFSYRIGLRDLTLARFDVREVLRVEAPEDPQWRPPPDALWKAVTFSTYNPAVESWEEDTEYLTFPWPQDGLLRLAPDPPPEEGVLLRHEVAAPVFKNLVTTYAPWAFEAGEFASYRRYASGDIFPRPYLEEGSVYHARVHPGASVRELFPEGDPDAARYLEIPPSDELEFGLEDLAASIFRGAPPQPAARIEELRRYLREEGFRYSNNALWRTGASRLRKFLLQERVGDCTYYATAAALLLRAGGVPTRLAVGFLGQDWDEERRQAVVRNQQAHAWIEARLDGGGWSSVDPTSWVPADPTYRPPPETVEGLRSIAQGSSGFRLRPAGSTPGVSHVGEVPRGGSRTGTGGRLGRYDAEEIPVDPNALAGQAAAADEEGFNLWIEYGGAFFEGETGTLGAELEAGVALVPRFGESEEARTTPGSRAETAGGSRPEKERFELRGAARTAVRIAIAVLGALVLALVVRSFLKPSEAEERPSEETDDLEAPAALAASALPSATELDGADPRDRILREYARLQSILRRTRNHRRPHQTPLEHGRSVTGKRPELEQAFRDLHKVLYALVYAGARADEDQAKVVARSSKAIARILG